jgi:hypothetical protein
MADDENKSAEDTESSTPGSVGEESTGKTTPDAPAPKKRAAPKKKATAKKAESSGKTRIEVQLSAAGKAKEPSPKRPEPPKPFWWRALLMVAVVVFLFAIIRNMAGPQSQETLPARAGFPAIPGESGSPDSGDVVVEEAPSLPPVVSNVPAPGYYGYPYPPQHPGYPQPEWSPPPYPMAPPTGYGYGYPYPQQHPWPPPYYYWYRAPWYPPYPGEPVPDE